MKQIKTAREMLAQIEKEFFKGTDLAEASMLEGDGRRTFVLSQVERLLTERLDSTPLAIWLSDSFWTADADRKPTIEAYPLLSPTGQETLTDEERSCLRLIQEIAGLCHDLSLHFSFDLEKAFGIKDFRAADKPLFGTKHDFSISNKLLVEWLTHTEYERIAMHTAYFMRITAIRIFRIINYLPAQDAMAELYSMEHHEQLRNPLETKIPPRDYVKTIIDTLQQIERHWRRAEKLKLKPQTAILHDEIYGVMPLRFDKKVLQTAQALYDYMDKEVYGRLLMKEGSVNYFRWSELPDSVRHTWDEVLGRFVEKVHEVRDKYLSEGWVADDSLAFSYLIDYAERCARGYWHLKSFSIYDKQ